MHTQRGVLFRDPLAVKKYRDQCKLFRQDRLQRRLNRFGSGDVPFSVRLLPLYYTENSIPRSCCRKTNFTETRTGKTSYRIIVWPARPLNDRSYFPAQLVGSFTLTSAAFCTGYGHRCLPFSPSLLAFPALAYTVGFSISQVERINANLQEDRKKNIKIELLNDRVSQCIF